jgi:hypothetical protein
MATAYLPSGKTGRGKSFSIASVCNDSGPLMGLGNARAGRILSGGRLSNSLCFNAKCYYGKPEIIVLLK